MKKFILFLVSFAFFSLLAAEHVFLRSSFPCIERDHVKDGLDGLRKIESISALARTSTAVLYAIAPDFYEPDPQIGDAGVNFIRQLSGTVNNLAAYALLEQSEAMRFTRILEIIAQNRSWHTAPGWENIDEFKMFIRELVVALVRGVSSEACSYAQKKSIQGVFDKNPNRIVVRSVDILAATLTVGLVELIFNFVDEKINQKESSRSFLRILGEQFYRELAFHTAGELIRLGIEQACKKDSLVGLTCEIAS